MLVDATHAALEDREEALDRVRVDRAVGQIDVLARAVGCETVASEVIRKVAVGVRFVSHHRGFAVNVRLHDRHQRSSTHVVHNHAARAARGTVHQRQHLHLVVEGPLLLRAFNPADESLVHLNDAATTAERCEIARAHGFPDTVREKPRRIILDFEDTAKLMGANALLAAHHQMNGLEHLVQRQLGILKHRADLGRELLAALATLLEAVADSAFRVLLARLAAHARQIVNPAANNATMRADRAIRPNHAFQIFEGCCFVVKARKGENGHNGIAPCRLS